MPSVAFEATGTAGAPGAIASGSVATSVMLDDLLALGAQAATAEVALREATALLAAPPYSSCKRSLKDEAGATERDEETKKAKYLNIISHAKAEYTRGKDYRQSMVRRRNAAMEACDEAQQTLQSATRQIQALKAQMVQAA